MRRSRHSEPELAGTTPTTDRDEASRTRSPSWVVGCETAGTAYREETYSMDETLTKILVATDGSEDATLAVRVAGDLARRAGARLEIVHVWRGLPLRMDLSHPAYSERMAKEYAELREREVEQVMGQQESEAEAAGAPVTRTYLREGHPAGEIVDLAGEIGADLVVVGSRGLGTIKRLLVGSVAEGVVRLAVCPTLVVRGGEGAWPPGRVVVGDDSSEEARAAGGFAARVGRLLEARLLVMRAYHPPEVLYKAGGGSGGVGLPEEFRKKSEGEMERRADELEPLLRSRPEVEIATGDPAAVIQRAVDESPEPTLTAVGRRGLGGVSRFPFGGVSTDVLRAVDGPVLIVPTPRP